MTDTNTAPVMVDPEWLAARLNDPAIVIVDVRAPYFYGQAHIPGAVSLPEVLLADRSGWPPQPAQTAEKLGRVGIARDSHVVAYDDGASSSAARLYWLLTYLRHPQVSILDGGITRWRHEGNDWEYNPSQLPAARYEAAEVDSSVLATVDDVKAAIEDGQTVVIDARSPAEYLGLQATAARDGHIPGALNVEWSTSFIRTRAGTVQLRPDTELRELYDGAGVRDDTPVIVYCQSAGRSSHSFAVLRHLGHTNVRNYAGSWQEWGNDPDLPVDGDG